MKTPVWVACILGLPPVASLLRGHLAGSPVSLDPEGRSESRRREQAHERQDGVAGGGWLLRVVVWAL